MKHCAALVLLALALLTDIFPAVYAGSRQKLVLSVLENKTHESMSGAVYEAFNRLSSRFDFQLQALPAARAAMILGHGQVDGAALRAKNLTDPKYSKNLIRVPTPLATGLLRLVVRDGMTEIKGWGEELKGLKVAMRRDSPAFIELIPESSLVEVSDESHALKMLQQGRVDAVAILDVLYYRVVVDHPELGRNLRFVKVAMPCPLYMFLHKDRKDLIPAVDAEIQKAVATGELQKAWDNGVNKIRKSAQIAVGDRPAPAGSLQ